MSEPLGGRCALALLAALGVAAAAVEERRERPAGVADMDWPALREAVAAVASELGLSKFSSTMPPMTSAT